MRALNLSEQRIYELLGRGVGYWVMNGFDGLIHDELRVIALVFGVSGAGSKARVMGRLSAALEVRSKLGEFEWNGVDGGEFWACVDSVANQYTFRVLCGMCRLVGVGSARSKKAMAAKLIIWRRDCRDKGKRNYKSMDKRMRSVAIQTTLKI